MMASALLVLASVGAPPCAWRLPYDALAVSGQSASLSSVATALGPATHRRVTLAAGSTLLATAQAPPSAFAPRSDLLCANTTGELSVVASASMFAGSGWWLNGGSWIYGRTNATHSFLYFQRMGELGELLEAAPIPTLSQVLLPTYTWPIAPPSAAPVPLGFLPPPLARNLTAREPLLLGDALLLEVASGTATADEQAAELVLMLEALRPAFTPPSTKLAPTEWGDVAVQAIAALEDTRTNRTGLVWKGRRYVRSYVNDYRQTPELLTQLDVLETLVRYEKSTGSPTLLGKQLRAAMAEGHFFCRQLGVITDWAGASGFSASSRADTWYLIFTHIKYAHLALGGEVWARTQLEASIDYVVRYGRKVCGGSACVSTHATSTEC
jgi:hypothetical protein